MTVSSLYCLPMGILNLVKGLFQDKKKVKKTAKRPAKKPARKPAAKHPKKSAPKTKAKHRPKPKQKQRQKPAEKPIGIVTHYFGKISVGIIKLKADMKIGDAVRIKGAHTDFIQRISSMQWNHQDINKAKKGAEIGVQVIRRVHENDRVYKG